jgi:histidine ammonia-lyase
MRINDATFLPPPLQAFMQSVSADSPFVDEDRALEADLRALTARIAACELLGQHGGETQ